MNANGPERPQLSPPRTGIRDAAAWLYWLDEAFRATPNHTWHSRAAWHRVAQARRHELSWLDHDRLATLELAALLHDVGRALDPEDTEPHGFVGAEFLDAIGLVDVAPLVAHHSGARFEAADRGMSHLDHWYSDPELLAIVTHIDRTTGPTGESVTLHQRRAAAVARFGADAPQLRWFDLSTPDALLGERLFAVRRTVDVA
jgi:hypothetical protein